MNYVYRITKWHNVHLYSIVPMWGRSSRDSMLVIKLGRTVRGKKKDHMYYNVFFAVKLIHSYIFFYDRGVYWISSLFRNACCRMAWVRIWYKIAILINRSLRNWEWSFWNIIGLINRKRNIFLRNSNCMKRITFIINCNDNPQTFL